MVGRYRQIREIKYRSISPTPIGLGICILCLILLSGCETMGVYNTATGRYEFIAVSTSTEIEMGNDIHKNISRKETLSTNSELNKRINRIGRRLAQVSDRQDYVHEFYVIEKDELNAFTTPGGKVYINSGLINRLETDDQIASVIAHEIGHGAAKHTIKKFQAALGYNLIGNLIMSQMDVEDQTKGIINLGSNVVMGLVFSAYGRKDEFEADRLGTKYMYLAGYNPNAAVEALYILRDEAKGYKTPLILRSHPYLDDRIRTVKGEIQALPHKYGKK